MHWTSRKIGGSVCALGGVALLLAVPPVASAEASCANVPSVETLFIELGPPGYNEVRIRRTGDSIVVGMACSGPAPTVTTVDTVSIQQPGDNDGLVILDYRLGPDSYSPGATGTGNDRGEKSDEIEFEIDLGPGSDKLEFDSMSVLFGGSKGFNANFGVGEVGPDADISARGIESVTYQGTALDDVASLAGGAGTGKPFSLFASLYGSGGNDFILGGRASETFFGGNGADRIRGGGGDDILHGDADGDRLEGEGGVDLLYGSYGNDFLNARDAEPDAVIDCGFGRDVVKFDAGLPGEAEPTGCPS